MTRKSLREFAMGRLCMVRAPGVCNFDPQTTVLAHIRKGTGLALKPPDICGVWACSACHDLIDGRVPSVYTPEQKDSLVLGALLRQLEWYDKHEVVSIVL